MSPTIIAYVEAGIIIILLLLIVFRKIGRPLSEAEAQEKINQKNERRRQQQMEYEKQAEKISAQEREIKSMTRPVTFVSLSGDYTEGRTLCVQDGNGNPHTLFCDDYNLDEAPLFNGLYQASKEPHYWSKRGAVLFQ